ncbi:Methyltranfer-dom domain-containing protein [Favolaschia claudopus]|uniref:Methyltranfer-dom domain-containing protein n=1 Tax=Favolaschia claudopus TaxID=2862362 RepID=A0AAW0CH58_9AGAR
MFSTESPLRRINRQALLQYWRWLVAFFTGFFLVLTIFLYGRASSPHTADVKKGYQDLLAVTDAASCTGLATAGRQRQSWLGQTLEETERRYRHTLSEREKLIAKEGGSQIDVFPPPRGRYYVLWDFFIPSFTCPFPTYRVGGLPDGGRWICGLERILQHRPNCLIYSLLNEAPSYSGFEHDMLERSSGCEIYAFDTRSAPSRWPWGDVDVASPGLLASRVHFNKLALADPLGSSYHSLQSVMQMFEHEWIDIVKMDLKGSEFATLLAMIADNEDRPLPFGQLILTINVDKSDDMKSVQDFKNWFTRLECAGLRPFYFEVSMMDVNNRRGEPSVVYWSFMNIRGKHALVDDELPDYP